MSDIVLIHPAGSNWIPKLESTVVSANRMAPIGIMTIASYLKRHGYSVAILDCCGSTFTHDHCVKFVKKEQPAFVGFSCTTSSFIDGYQIAEKVKEELPETKIIFGGVHVSSQQKKTLELFPAIDATIVGEGEEAMLSYISGQPLAEIEGLVYHDGPSIRYNGVRKSMLDLDTLPFPDYHGLPGFPQEYNLPLFNYPRAPNTTMVTSRGCPFQCLFCDRSVFRKGFRFNSAHYIYEHLHFLNKEFQIRHVNIYDDLFTYDRNRILSLTDMLMTKPLPVTYNCAVRYDRLDDEILDSLKRSGCWMISIGIESGDEDVLKLNKTQADIGEIFASVQKIKNHGLRVKGLFMMGLPGETKESLKKTIEFIKKLPLDDMNISKFTPFPGAPVYKVIQKFGEMSEDWTKMNCMNFVFKPNGFESLDELERLYNNAIASYYERPQILLRYIKMIWQSPHSWISILKKLPDFIRAWRHFHNVKV